MGLGLPLGVRTKREIDFRDVSQVGMTFLIGNPDFVQHSIVGDLFKSPVDLVRADSRRLPQGHEMCRQRGLYDHLLADGRFHITHDSGTESRAASQQPSDDQPLGFAFSEQPTARVPTHRRAHPTSPPAVATTATTSNRFPISSFCVFIVTIFSFAVYSPRAVHALMRRSL